MKALQSHAPSENKRNHGYVLLEGRRREAVLPFLSVKALLFFSLTASKTRSLSVQCIWCRGEAFFKHSTERPSFLSGQTSSTAVSLCAATRTPWGRAKKSIFIQPIKCSHSLCIDTNTWQRGRVTSTIPPHRQTRTTRTTARRLDRSHAHFSPLPSQESQPAQRGKTTGRGWRGQGH